MNPNRKNPMDRTEKSARQKEQEKKVKAAWDKAHPSYGSWPRENKILESFKWLSPDLKALPSKDKRKVFLKVIIARAGDVSLNRRKYVREELMKAARTFAGMPVFLDHDPNKKIGDIVASDFEDDQLEQLWQIDVEPHVTHLRRSRKDKFSGVSMEANYRFNVCPICRERFMTDEEFYNHQELVHMVKHGVQEPHGLHGVGASLVSNKERPGIPTAGFDIIEMGKTMNRLYETIKQDREGLGTKEQEAPCPEGMHKDAETGLCVEDVVGTPEDKDSAECPEGFHKNAEGQCVEDVVGVASGSNVVDEFVARSNRQLREYRDSIADLRKKVADMQEYMETFEKTRKNTVKESVDLVTRVSIIEKQVIPLVNFQDKMKGSFKAVTAGPGTPTTKEYVKDPLKGE